MPYKILSPNDIYEIVICDGYILEEGEKNVFIFDRTKGYGAISLTNYKIPEDYDFKVDKELQDFAFSIAGNINRQDLKVVRGEFSFGEFIIKGKYWKIWVFLKNRHAVFASYNCDEKDRCKEIDNIDMMMHSLRILH